VADPSSVPTAEPTPPPVSSQPASASSEALADSAPVQEESSSSQVAPPQEAEPVPAQAPAEPAPPAQTPETDVSTGTAAFTAYGAVPFELAAGTGKWWKIDSTDTAYWAVQENINAMRAAGGLPALTMDDTLSTTASSRCESFVAGGPFDHSGMVTKSEICARGPLFSAADVCTAWQNSETHYANIMRTDISSMGVSCWFCEMDGSKYTYWTVTFE